MEIRGAAIFSLCEFFFEVWGYSFIFLNIDIYELWQGSYWGLGSFTNPEKEKKKKLRWEPLKRESERIESERQRRDIFKTETADVSWNEMWEERMRLYHNSIRCRIIELFDEQVVCMLNK